jgi:glycosyltransferase involved in cell wall biosynthesis
VKQLGLSNRIKFIGRVEPGEVSNYYAMADIFIGVSKTAKNGWVEAQGLTFIEAMMTETPVVATATGGIVDSVIHEKTGLLVHENAPNEIADAVLRLVSDPELSKKLSKEGRALSLEKFSCIKSAESFSQLFEKVARTP